MRPCCPMRHRAMFLTFPLPGRPTMMRTCLMRPTRGPLMRERLCEVLSSREPGRGASASPLAPPSERRRGSGSSSSSSSSTERFRSYI